MRFLKMDKRACWWRDAFWNCLDTQQLQCLWNLISWTCVLPAVISLSENEKIPKGFSWLNLSDKWLSWTNLLAAVVVEINDWNTSPFLSSSSYIRQDNCYDNFSLFAHSLHVCWVSMMLCWPLKRQKDISTFVKEPNPVLREGSKHRITIDTSTMLFDHQQLRGTVLSHRNATIIYFCHTRGFAESITWRVGIQVSLQREKYHAAYEW